MQILAGQLAMSLAVLLFAAVALRVAGALPPQVQRFAYAWKFTGLALLLSGSNSLFHDVFATIAFMGGPESAAWAAVLRWHPVLNHSRTFLLSTYCLVLAVALYRVGQLRQPPRMSTGMGIVVAGMLVGALVGANEASFSGITHFSAVAIFDIMELVAVMTLLALGLTSGAMDRSLWVAIGINGFILALSVLLFAAMSRIEFAGQWSPQPFHLQWTKALLHILMVGIAVRHLHRIRQGRPVRALLDAPREAVGVPSLHL
jgi:hypothetical protein